MPTYRVIGGKKILGHKPAEEFEADLPEDQERRLMALGHIELVEDEDFEETELARLLDDGGPSTDDEE